MCEDGSRVVPVEEEEGEGTHNEEEENPHTEAGIVLHCLENKSWETFEASTRNVIIRATNVTGWQIKHLKCAPALYQISKLRNMRNHSNGMNRQHRWWDFIKYICCYIKKLSFHINNFCIHNYTYSLIHSVCKCFFQNIRCDSWKLNTMIYLSDFFISLFDVFCCANHHMSDTVNLRFLAADR